MAFPTGISPSLLGLPIEILLDIYQHLDVSSIFELCATSRSLLDFFTQHRATILLPVLCQEFGPFDEFLQVYTASVTDLSPSGRYTPKYVVFKRWPGDKGQPLTPGSAPPSTVAHDTNGFTHVGKGRRGPILASSKSASVTLDERDLDGILKHCRLVRKWEGIFPQMRWFYEPENCRSLRSHESFRFRRALYRWWLYSIHFHGDQPRPRVGLPEPRVEDIRTSQMRRHSTSELLELMDLIETVKDVILHYICPRLDPSHMQVSCFNRVALNSLLTGSQSSSHLPLVDYGSRQQSLSTSWNDQSRWGRILKTYAKLGPKDIMFYFENIYSYPRHRLITEIHLQHPNFTFDQESIQVAIRCTLDERKWLERFPSLAEDSVGGIVDFDDERDNERLAFGGDANPDGALPSGLDFVRSLSQYSPRGDDGSHLEDQQRQTGYGARVMATATMGTVYSR
ncbi:hypothetical protein HJFPF1_07914 [Paramyrothecium foliicola]|nr:hypothetical protein HJFPF1_07914 [Paramyrothecium foliicola]